MNTKSMLRIIIGGIRDQTMNCIRYELRCLDPPCLTSGMLDLYGIKSFSSKNTFWKNIDTFINKYNNIIIYRGRFGEFKMVFDHSIDRVFRIENTNIYVDSLDCENISCTSTPKTHVLRIYIEGRYGNRSILRMNIITLLAIAVSESPYFRECFEDFVQDPFDLNKVSYFATCSLYVLSKHKSIYDILFKRVPKSYNDIVNEISKYSPILRRMITGKT